MNRNESPHYHSVRHSLGLLIPTALLLLGTLTGCNETTLTLPPCPDPNLETSSLILQSGSTVLVDQIRVSADKIGTVVVPKATNLGSDKVVMPAIGEQNGFGILSGTRVYTFTAKPVEVGEGIQVTINSSCLR